MKRHVLWRDEFDEQTWLHIEREQLWNSIVKRYVGKERWMKKITLEYKKKNFIYLYKKTKKYASFKTKNLNVVDRVTSQCLFGPMTISKRYTDYPWVIGTNLSLCTTTRMKRCSWRLVTSDTWTMVRNILSNC